MSTPVMRTLVTDDPPDATASGQGGFPASLIALIGVAFLVVGVVHLLRWHTNRQDPDERAFRALAKSARLNQTDQRVLRRVADIAEIPSPGAILISPATCRSAIIKAIASGAGKGMIKHACQLAERTHGLAMMEAKPGKPATPRQRAHRDTHGQPRQPRSAA